MARLTVKRYSRIIPPYTQGQFLIAYARSFLVTKCRTVQGAETELPLQLTNLGEEIGDFSPFRTGLNVFLKDGFSCMTYRNIGENYIDFECLCCPDVIESAGVSNVVSVDNALKYDAESGVYTKIPLSVTGNVRLTNELPLPVEITNSGGDYVPYDLEKRIVVGRFTTVEHAGKTAFIFDANASTTILSRENCRVLANSGGYSGFSFIVNGVPSPACFPFWLGEGKSVIVTNTLNTSSFLRFNTTGA